MRNIQIITILALTILGAQSKPDYNGTWVVNRDKSAKAIQDGAVTNERLTITVTENEVTIGDDPGRLVCGFGPKPTESKSTQPMPGILCSAKWDGDQLVTTMTRKPNPTMQGVSTPTVTRLSLAGTELKTTSKIRLANGSELTRLIVYDKAR